MLKEKAWHELYQSLQEVGGIDGGHIKHMTVTLETFHLHLCHLLSSDNKEKYFFNPVGTQMCFWIFYLENNKINEYKSVGNSSTPVRPNSLGLSLGEFWNRIKILVPIIMSVSRSPIAVTQLMMMLAQWWSLRLLLQRTIINRHIKNTESQSNHFNNFKWELQVLYT